MATITHREIIEQLLANDGMYPGDPQVGSIWEYRRAITQEVMWAVFYDPAHFDLDSSPFVAEYQCLWDCEAGHLSSMGVVK